MGSSTFNILLHGEPADAAALLGEGIQFDVTALRAALTNALYRIDRLQTWSELEITRLENQIERLSK